MALTLKIVIITVGIVSCACLFYGCASKNVFTEEQWLADVEATDSALLYADNRKPNGKFFNPWMPRDERPSYGSPFSMWSSKGKREYEPFDEAKYAAVHNDYGYLKDPAHNSISYYGHATLIIKMNGETVITDPFFSNRAAIRSKNVKIKFDYDKVPEKPVVLISHNHYDHLDKQSIKPLIKKDAVFIVPSGLSRLLKKWGVKNIHELNWWESITIGDIKYTFLPAQHWAYRPWAGETLWGGFMIEGGKTIYFSGDTGYFKGFKEFGRKYEIDYAIIGAAAYDPRWFMHYIHTNVKEFFMAADDLQAKVSIPMHFGVIKLSNEPILYPLYEIDKYINENDEYREKVHAMRVGEFLTFIK